MPNSEDFLPMEWNVSQDAEPANPGMVKDIETNSVNLSNSHFKKWRGRKLDKTPFKLRDLKILQKSSHSKIP